jgi:hypothetical protein
MKAFAVTANHLPLHVASPGWLTPQELLLLCFVTLAAGGAIRLGPLVIQGPKRPRRRKRQRR